MFNLYLYTPPPKPYLNLPTYGAYFPIQAISLTYPALTTDRGPPQPLPGPKPRHGCQKELVFLKKTRRTDLSRRTLPVYCWPIHIYNWKAPPPGPLVLTLWDDENLDGARTPSPTPVLVRPARPLASPRLLAFNIIFTLAASGSISLEGPACTGNESKREQLKMLATTYFTESVAPAVSRKDKKTPMGDCEKEDEKYFANITKSESVNICLMIRYKKAIFGLCEKCLPIGQKNPRNGK